MHRLAAALRRRALPLCALALLLAGTPAAAQQAAVDPVLLRLLQPQVRDQALGYGARALDAPTAEPPLGGTVAFDADAEGRTRVGVLVEARSPDVARQLRAMGVSVGSVTGGILTARVPLDLLPRVLELPVERVQASRVLRLVHDSSMVAIGADRVRQRTESGWVGVTGAGALVGIVDTGIDLLHADFHDDDGVTRVLALWDQLAIGAPAPGFGYGMYCTRDRIQLVVSGADSGACPTQDLNGHGTHVAGTAAGDGSAGGPPFRYAGVAPEAELLVVKAGNGSFSEDRVIDGLHWIREEARRHGRPVVVNLSLGHQYGPHDGTTLFERVIDDLSAPGFIVVLAAGNDGVNMNALPAPTGDPPLIHARVQPVAGQVATIGFRVTPYTPSSNGCDGNFVQLSAWYDVRARIEVTVIRPNGSRHTVAAGARAISDDAQGRIEIYNAFPLSAYTGTAEALIEVNGCPPSGVPAEGDWLIQFRPLGPGDVTGIPIDVYLHTVALGRGGAAFGTTGFDNRFLVGSPGGALRGITVGAFVSRLCWPSRSAPAVCYTSRPAVGDLAVFSAAGPTRDGRIKPEIVAPGMGIMSALSRYTAAPAARISPDGAYWILEGTSMAAPHVAGAVALMFQYRPGLGPEEVLDVLTRSARQDAFTTRVYDRGPAAAPSDWWGYGKLDVPAALELLLGGGDIAQVRIEPRIDTIPQGGTRQLRAIATDAGGGTVFANWSWSSLDPAVATVTQSGVVRGVQPGTARIVAAAGARADTALIVVQPPAVIAVGARSASPAAPVLGQAGALLPLLIVRLEASGPEAVQVEALGFEVSGDDAEAALLLLEAGPGAGADSTAAVRGRIEVALTPEPRAVTVPLDTFTVPRNGVRELVLAVRLSGGAPAGAAFAARLRLDLARTVTANSGVRDRVVAGDAVASAPATTTVLRQGEAFALSENPVRNGSVVLNFAERPASAAIYTATGSRVADLLPRFAGLSYRWDLTNDRGDRIVPGVYLLVARVGERTVRERIMVLLPDAGRAP